MKSILATMCLVLGCGSASSQTQQGSWELSMSGNLGSVSGSTETTGAFNSKSEQPSRGYLSLALRPGFYILDGLEVEPEILLTAVEMIPPSFIFTGNLAYNFRIPHSPVTPFVLAGYGTGNAIPYLGTLYRSSEELDISVLNIGTGLKVFVAENIALRIEYRYQRYSQETGSSSGPFSFTTRSIKRFHNLFFGFSVFLP